MNVFMLTERLRRRGLWLFGLLIAATLTFSACDLVGDDSDDEQEQEQAQQEEMQQAETAASAPARPAAQPPSADEGPEPPPAAAGGGAGATAYSIVFPSIAFVMAADSIATGLVISDGYVLVDGRSFGAATTADVLLSNGETLEDVPVVGRDQFTGLAYLGPLDANLVRRLPGARLGDGESIRPGSSVFMIGYSADDEANAVPVVYSGVLSGTDEWDVGQRTLLRTDARPASVTAGMILVDGSGTVIGFAANEMVAQGWYVSTGDLARSLSADQMAESAPASAVATATEHTLTLPQGQQSVSLLLSDEAIGERTPLVTVRTETASLLQLFDGVGELQQEASLVIGSTIVALAPESIGPYEIVLRPESVMAMESDEDEQSSETAIAPATYEVNANVPLMVVVEAMAVINVDEPFVGNIDFAGDVDRFNLALRAGAEYEILVQSLLFDTVLLVEGGGLDAVDDDTGGGPFGRDSALMLAPEQDSIVQLTVKDYANVGTGAYILTVTQVGGEAPEQDMAMDEEAAMTAMAAELPAPSPPPAVSLRGIGTEDGLQATLLGIGSQSVGNALQVDDADGSFEITVSVVGADGALGRVSVRNVGDEIVVEGRVLVTCGGSGSCLAQAVFVANEGQAGPWTVELNADGPGIAEWQIEVLRND